MKKIFSVFMLLLALTMVLPATIAMNETNSTNSTTDYEVNYNETDFNITGDDVAYNETDNYNSTTEDNTTDYEEETSEEVEVMTSNYGSEMRLLQLQYSIEKQILNAKSIIGMINEENPDADTSELSAIVDSMNSLLEDVKAESENISDDSVEVFVDYKQEAIDLTKQFRDLSRELVTPEIAAKIRHRVKNEIRHEIKGLKERISRLRGKVNSERVKNFLGKDFAETHPKLFKQIENGEITPKEAKKELKESLKELAKDKKSDLIRRVKEEKAKAKVRTTARVSKILENQANRLSDRFQERSQKLAEEGKGKAAKFLEKQSERLKDRAEKISERRKEVKTENKDRIRDPNTHETESEDVQNSSNEQGGDEE